MYFIGSMVYIAISIGYQYNFNIFMPVKNVLYTLNVTKLKRAQLIFGYICVVLVSFHLFSENSKIVKILGNIGVASFLKQ